MLADFIQKLEIPAEADRLLKLKPSTYIGKAVELAKRLRSASLNKKGQAFNKPPFFCLLFKLIKLTARNTDLIP